MSPASPHDGAAGKGPGRRIPDPGFAGDAGAPDAALRAALAAQAADPGRRPEVLAALHTARVLGPVVALLGEIGQTDAGRTVDKSADIAVPLLGGQDGRAALPVFSSLAAMAAWDPDARPVPLSGPHAGRVALTEGAQALAIDVAGPHPCALEGAEVVALVEGRGRVPAYRDAALGDRLQSLARATPGVRSVTLTPATGADGCLQLHLAPAADPGQVT